MTDTIPLFDLNPDIDVESAASEFAKNKRVQIRNFLTEAAAQTVSHVLSRETPWGMAWRAADEGPHGLRRQQVATLGPERFKQLMQAIETAMRGRDYAFLYAQYNLLDAHREGWGEHEALDLLVEHINSEPMMDIIRQVTGIPQLYKADAQATLYGPNHFLAMHDDSHVAEGWQVAYVMNFCPIDWRPDWGGYLMFYDDEGDVISGFKPRFNAINLFKVPQHHNVTYVPPFAPVGRFAITGWFRDR
jgi:Rps23 Pro-64 3,4-dihydroxylase Tpa1-like proline 4-hydroxylase